MLNSKSHLCLIDGSGFIFRAYHAMPALTRSADGLPIGAVVGFCNMLWALFQDHWQAKDSAMYTHIGVVFDSGRTTFRNQIYSDYKMNRPPVPEDLIPQFPIIRNAVRAFSLHALEQSGYEADDLIATYAAIAKTAGARTTIVSSDKDLMQLVDSQTSMYDPIGSKNITTQDVIAKFGVAPDMLADLLALVGDKSDNVPGVPGIGVKTAASLLLEHGSLDVLMDRINTITQPARRRALLEAASQIRISRRLVQLCKDVPLLVDIEQLASIPLDPSLLTCFLHTMDFRTLLTRVTKAGLALPSESFVSNTSPSAVARNPEIINKSDNTWHNDGYCVASLKDKILNLSPQNNKYQNLCMSTLRSWCTVAIEYDRIAFNIHMTQDSSNDDPKIVGIAMSIEVGEAVYVAINDNFQEILDILRPILISPSILKVGYNLKQDYVALLRHDVHIACFDDTMLMAYVLNNRLAGADLQHVYQYFFTIQEGTNVFCATENPAAIADTILRLWTIMRPQLIYERLLHVYERLDRGLVSAVATMEYHGVIVDKATLEQLSHEFSATISALEAQIYEIAGENFNIASPKQLGAIMFEKLGLPSGKLTKTKSWSTDSSVLEELADQYTFPQLVLQWRHMTKLVSTYTDTMPQFIRANQRVHTCYALASTSTGRIASSQPNLQNIPIRTPEGRKIRKAFVAPPDSVLLSADYNQIELRILAHIANSQTLQNAFARGEDIHLTTASELFGIEPQQVSQELRRQAKMVNFGIIYGISSFGLAQRLRIRQTEAKAFIDAYFTRFPEIKNYIEQTKTLYHQNGYITTIFGRRIYIGNIDNTSTSSHTVRAFNEREAINAPIQGSAADILRRAIIKLDHQIKSGQVAAKMILQVHDELVFEVPRKDLDHATHIIGNTMRNSGSPAINMSVNLEIGIKVAESWGE